MNINIDDAGIAIISLDHAKSMEDIRAADKALLDLMSQLGSMDAIYDCREADFSTFRREEFSEHAAWLSSQLHQYSKHIALVADDDMEFGICRMWEMQAESLAPVERRVFRDMEQARTWLKSFQESCGAS